MLGNSEGGFALLPKPPPKTDCAGKAGARATITAGEPFSDRLLVEMHHYRSSLLA